MNYIEIGRVERSLHNVQRNFDVVNKKLNTQREPMTEEIVYNLVRAYRHLDTLVDRKNDLFSGDGLTDLVDLNYLVLCAHAERTAPDRAPINLAARFRAARGESVDKKDISAKTLREMYEAHRNDRSALHYKVAIEERVREMHSWIAEWYDKHRKESVYKRAAGLYVRALSQPQLFIEGNHRTGCLIASLELLREGEPPFVLSVDNAKAYFDPSSIVKHECNKKSWHNQIFKIPKMKKVFARFLEDHVRKKYLL